MLKAKFAKYILDFKEPARTSRETMKSKTTYFIKVFDNSDPLMYGIGECPLFEGLSCDDVPEYEDKLRETCERIETLAIDELMDFPSIRFGVETAMLDYRNGGRRLIMPSAWTEGDDGICINGLIWMGSINEMRERIETKLVQGFRCLKFKIGGENFDDELELLSAVRQRFSSDILTIRLDANGAFNPDDAMSKLCRLSTLDIHSIEQPIKAGQLDELHRICMESPIPIALDEELIGINTPEDKFQLLNNIRPSYIILKPALCGGISGAQEWISCAALTDTGWWVTSALESNIGLNALAQWVSTLNALLPQGLGTGALYTNNIESPLRQHGDSLYYEPFSNWKLPDLQWL